jgi:thiol-disulfide isomerase/thioredoxin
VSDNIKPFETDSFASLIQRFEGKPFLVSLWSLDCLPCRVELQLLGEMLAENPEFPLLLVSTDDIQLREEALIVLEDYQLDRVESFMFSGSFTERLRYSIDPTWYGELPRSYFYAADGSRRAHSGVITRAMVDEAF